MEGRVFENFSKNQKSFKIPKMPKTVPKSVQTKILKCFQKFFRNSKIFAQSRSQKCQSLRKISKKSKNFQNSKKAQNRSQKCPNVFFEKNFCPVFQNENFQKKIKKIFKIPKMPKIVPKSVQTCFEHVFQNFFEKNFCPVFHGGSSLRKFSKKSKNFQNSKNAQNRSQKCPNVF